MVKEENNTKALSVVTMNTKSANQATNSDNVEGKNTKGSIVLSPSQSRRASTVSQSKCSKNTDRQCPIGLCYFPAHITQSYCKDHTDARMNPEAVLYNDLMFEENVLCEVESDATS